MISYRKLAMRVLGHPLRVPTNTPRPASHRVTALALTAAMVAGMAAPAYAGTYYIGDGDITITKDEKGDVYVKHADNKDKSKGDVDNGDIIIKGGKRSEDTTGTGSEGGNSSEGGSSGTGTPANSPVQSASATLKAEDSENEDKDMVYPGDTKGSDSSEGSGEENENQSTEKNQTIDTTDGKNTGAGSSDPESKGSDDGTSGSESGTTGSGGSDTKAGDTPTTGSGTPAEGAESTGSTTGSDDTTGGEENAPKPGGTPTPAEGTESTESNRSAPESQFTYTGASLKVASANDDEETRNESTTVLKRAAENFKNTAENVTNYVIRIINKATGNDNTLNVTLDNVNIDVSSSKTNNAALSVEGAGDTKITLEGKNTLTSGNQCAGLEHNEESMGTTGKLTITSGTDDNGSNTGSLTATGSGASAGIGSGTFSFGSGAGTIEITGGDITAIGSSDGAGIGSGYGATGNTNITISGTAKINAQTKQGGAGIGSGSGATGNTNITISGGTIENAQGGSGGAGIGGGQNSTGQTTVTIKSGTIKNATGGNTGDGIGGGLDSKNITVKIEGGTIEKAQGGQGYGRYHDAGDGIHSDGDLTISGNATIDSAIGGSCGSDASDRNAGHGIYSGGKLTIEGGTIGTAQGGNATDRNKNAGDGIYSVGELTIEGGRIEQAAGGDATGKGGTGGDGIGSYGALTISGSANIGTAQGGASTNGTGGDGIHSGSVVKISGDTITKATGGNATGEDGDGGSGIGGSFVNIAGGTISAAGGSGKSGGAGVSTESGIVSIGNSDTPLDLTATAPDADNAIRGRDGKKLDEIIHLEENGKRGLVKLVENGVTRLFHNGVYTKSIYPAGSETHPLGDWVITKKPTCTEPGERQRSCKIEHCVVTETEELPALGHQWSGWMPVQGDSSREYRICAVCNEVEYRDVSHNSGSGDSTISTGLRVLDPAQADILQNAQLVRLNRISDVLYIDVSHETASLQGVLSDLTGLRSERIGTVVFSTERCTSTLSLSDVAALGAGDTPFTLRHSGSTATFTVGGADHSALLR